jgi:tetratricopeptide (TPR) repeat protein
MYYETKIIGISSSAIVDGFFSATAPRQSQFDSLSNKALSKGIDLYTNKDYDGAVREFKRAIALSPFGDYSDKAYEYMANAYLNQNKVSDAINTYKQMLRRNPSDDAAHLSLGNIYYKGERYREAEQEYSLAVRINPGSARNHYTLGMTYMTTGQFSEAENQFRKVTQLTPHDPNAYDALGQALRRLERYDDAVVQFKKAITLDKKFSDGYLSLGCTYADMKRMDEAQQQADLLAQIDTQKASNLQEYIVKAADPGFSSVLSINGFPLSAGRGTRVSTLDNALITPNSSKSFTLMFMFSKEMDASSVQNPNNWQISRATGKYLGGAYNLGLPVPSTEVPLPATPMLIKYDEGAHMAEVTFRISQKSFADGTIDPSHIVFRFTGKDAYGNAMDPTADEYSSISKIV